MNVEHCGASASKRYIAALNCYIAKALPVKYQIITHRLWHVAKQGLSLSEKVLRKNWHDSRKSWRVPHNGAICSSYSG